MFQVTVAGRAWARVSMRGRDGRRQTFPIALASLLAVLLAGCALVAPPAGDTPASPPAASPPQGERARVVWIADGDTIRVAIGERQFLVRYIGVDAPESPRSPRGPQCFWEEATERNRQLVGDRMVTLERDVSDTDRHGRLLRYVWLDGRMVNEDLVRSGHARARDYPPDTKHQARLREAQRQAQRERAGLWACP